LKSQQKRICVVGTGYVGMISAIGFAELGHQVTGYDIIPEHLRALHGGKTPYREDGLEDASRRQLDADQAKAPIGPSSSEPADGPGGSTATGSAPPPTGAPVPVAALPKRFHGTVTLDPTRVGRDASRVADDGTMPGYLRTHPVTFERIVESSESSAYFAASPSVV